MPTQDLERRLARAKGHRSEDETRALNLRIEQLSKAMEGVAAQHSMLVGQVGGACRVGRARPGGSCGASPAPLGRFFAASTGTSRIVG